jgi:hypothetical protein
MTRVRVSIESLRLNLTGCSPETARHALDGLDRELERRLERRLISTPAFGRGLERDGGGADGENRTLGVTVETRTRLEAPALRALIAEKLLDTLGGPGDPSPNRGAGT